MGCGPSKVVESLPLVTLCKERRESIKAVSDHRYALASAHVSYFRSLRDVGDALARFVDQEVVIGVRLPPDSPVLTLPSDPGKRKKRGNHNGNSLSSSSSLSHHASSSLSDPTHHFPDHENRGVGSGSDDESPTFRSHSHLHLSGESDSESDPSSSGHLHIEESSEGSGVASPKLRKEEGTEEEVYSSMGYPYPPYPHSPSHYFPPRPPPGGSWTPPGVLRNGSYAYYMKRSPSLIPSFIYEEPQRSSVRWADSSSPNPYSTYPQDGGASGGFFGFSVDPVSDAYSSNRQPGPPAEPEPPPPPPPIVSAWDFLDPFKTYHQGGYMSYYPQTETSMSSSPDSKEVREREGIPELEEETEQEFLREKKIGKTVRDEEKKHGISVEGTSNVKKAAPWQNRDPVEGTSNVKKAAPWQNRDPVEGTSNGKKAAPRQNRDPVEGTSNVKKAAPWQNRDPVEGTSNVKKAAPRQNRDPVEGTSNVKKAAPRQNRDPFEGTSNEKKAAPWQYRDPAAGRLDSESLSSSMDKKIGSSSDTVLSKGTEDGSVGKKESSFEIDEVSSTQEIESSRLSSQEVESSKHSGLTTVHCSRDLQEVVKEIRDEFVTASGFGREVALMLEVGKVPYRPRNSAFKVIFSRILYFVAPSVLFSHSSSTHYVRSASSITEMANGYYWDPDSNNRMKRSNLSSTLDKLYVWEQKLYKEVKEEERLRVIYEKMCKRLKKLDLQGADSSKIDAMQTSIKKWQAKIKVCIRAIDVVSIRIHKLRDEELQPQINQLINGWTRMWKSMFKCHQKQFQAIMESKILTLRANPVFQRDSNLTAATVELEMELLKWCSRFNEWVDAQRSYVESLNGWLTRCILREPEETDDGLAPFSPCRAGAPPIFTVCSDWCQAMERIAENVVADAMHDFAISLHQLWETLDEEHHQRLKAEYLSKDFEKRLRTVMLHKGTLVNGVPSGSGVSRRDDLRVDLDLMNKRLQEERVRHKEAVKLADDAASSSIQAGLVPIFEALTKCSSEAVKAYEQVRTQLVGGGP